MSEHVKLVEGAYAPYKVGQYGPDAFRQPFIRLWGPDGSVIQDFLSTEAGREAAYATQSLLNAAHREVQWFLRFAPQLAPSAPTVPNGPFESR